MIPDHLFELGLGAMVVIGLIAGGALLGELLWLAFLGFLRIADVTCTAPWWFGGVAGSSVVVVVIAAVAMYRHRS